MKVVNKRMIYSYLRNERTYIKFTNGLFVKNKLIAGNILQSLKAIWIHRLRSKRVC